MKKLTIFFATIVLTALACQASATQTAPPNTDMNQIIASTAAAALTQTAQPSIPSVESSPIPQPTPTEVQAHNGEVFAWNYMGSQTIGGVTVEIARFLLADKAAITNLDFSNIQAMQDKNIVAEIVFKVTNTTQQVMSVYPDQGTVIAGSEQIPLIDYMFLGTFGDSVGGEIYPGVTKIGGIWFGVARSTIAEIQQVTIVFDAPHDENFNSSGGDYSFVLDLSNRQNQPIPEELK